MRYQVVPWWNGSLLDFRSKGSWFEGKTLHPLRSTSLTQEERNRPGNLDTPELV